MADEEVEDGGEGEHCEEEQDVHRPRRERCIGAEQVAYAHIDEELQNIQPVGSVAEEGEEAARGARVVSVVFVVSVIIVVGVVFVIFVV